MTNYPRRNPNTIKLLPKIIISLILLLSFALDFAFAQDDLDVLHLRGGNWLKHTDAQNSLYQHIANQAYQLLEERENEISAINTLTGWQERQQFLKMKLTEIIGPFPEKTALNARITRTITKDNYSIEHIIFESRPDFYVTASLFLPDKTEHNKTPAILYCSGHTSIAHRAPTGTYQKLILNLVNKGFIVFAFDPVGQGERLEYYDPETGGSIVGSSTREHSYPGAQALITGNSQAGYMAWDGVRAVDYLLSRNEVDPDRIGITGCSGGGTQAAYIAALDDRIKAVANQCYITNFTRLFQTIGPQDAEQNLFNGIKQGIDHADYLTVRAPKPSLILSTTEDFFSIHGARQTAGEVSEIYNAYGKPYNFSMVEDMGGHGTTRKNREAMNAFFQEHLDHPGSPVEEEVEFLVDDELRVTSTGQISTSLNGETVFSLNRKESEKLLAGLEESRKDLKTHLPAAVSEAKSLSGYIAPEKIKEPVFTGRIQRDGYIIEKYFLQGEGDYVIPYLLMIPERSDSKALIYLHPSGKAEEASPGGEAEWFVNKGFTVLAPDMVGIGETGPGVFRGDAYIEGISYNIWFGSMLIGRSITGIRAGDISRLTMLLEERDDTDEIYALAKGEISPDLLHASAFNPLVSRIALIEPYSSYRSIVMNRFYDPSSIHGAVPGALKAYDLPDLAASIAPRKLMLVNVRDAAAESDNPEEIEKDMEVIRNAYRYKNAWESLIIESGSDLDVFFNRWIED